MTASAVGAASAALPIDDAVKRAATPALSSIATLFLQNKYNKRVPLTVAPFFSHDDIDEKSTRTKQARKNAASA